MPWLGAKVLLLVQAWLLLAHFTHDSSCSVALLDPTTSSWGGGYTLVGEDCAVPNPITGYCSCPEGYSDSVQVFTDVQYLGGLYDFFPCYSVPLLPASQSDFRGIYIIGDGLCCYEHKNVALIMICQGKLTILKFMLLPANLAA